MKGSVRNLTSAIWSKLGLLMEKVLLRSSGGVTFFDPASDEFVYYPNYVDVLMSIPVGKSCIIEQFTGRSYSSMIAAASRLQARNYGRFEFQVNDAEDTLIVTRTA